MDKVGYQFTYAGENLAVNFTDSADVTNAWMASPLHKANILSPDFKEIGISMHDTVYQDKNTIFVVQMFGTRADTVLTTKEDSKIATQKSINKTPAVLSASTPTASTTTSTTNSTTTPSPTVVSASVVAPEVRGDSTTSVPSAAYATNVDKTIFNSTQYASFLLTIIFVFVFVALLILIFFEIEKQHPKHILYGFFTLSLILVCAYVVKNVFALHFVLL
jgi:hypothetical protein